MWIRLLAVTLAGWIAGAQERQVGKGVNFYSLEKEAKLGAMLAEEFRKNHTILDSAMVRDYVEQAGRQVAAQLPEGGHTYAFEILADNTPDHPMHEPISLPGGYIFVPSALFLAAENEAEFAGMLAHAMAHVAERHGTRLATRGQLAQVSAIPLIFMGGWSGSGEGGGLLPVGFLAFQREFELQADRLAVRTMSGAGFDPAALVSYVGRTQVDRTARIYSPLPDRETRLERLRQAVQALPAQTYSSSGQYQRIREEVRHLTPEPARRAPSLR